MQNFFHQNLFFYFLLAFMFDPSHLCCIIPAAIITNLSSSTIGNKLPKIDYNHQHGHHHFVLQIHILTALFQSFFSLPNYYRSFITIKISLERAVYINVYIHARLNITHHFVSLINSKR